MFDVFSLFRSVRQGDQSRMPAEPFRLEVTFRSSHTIDAVNKRQIRSLRQLQSCKSSVPALEEEMACRQQLRTSESCVVHVEFKGSKAELNSKEMEIEVAAFFFARERHQPGQQTVAPDNWVACSLATNRKTESRRPLQKAYSLLFAGSPGWYVVTFSALCRHHFRNQDQPMTCRICQKAVGCLSCSTIVEVEASNARAEWRMEPELRRFSSAAMFVHKPQYNNIMKRLQVFEYNGKWKKFIVLSKMMRKTLRSPELKIVIDFETAIGQLYMGKKNILKAEKLVTHAINDIRELASASESRILEARANYILSGIRRHQKRRDEAKDCVATAKQLLFGVKPGEDTAAVLYNEASILLETGDENFQESLRLFISSIDHCRAYDSSINMVPERAHIRLAWLCLSSNEFTVEYGVLLLDDLDCHAKRIEEAANHLSAVNEHILPVRYQIQYLIPLCDLYIARMQLLAAKIVAKRVRALAVKTGYQRETAFAKLRVDYLESLPTNTFTEKRDHLQVCLNTERGTRTHCHEESTCLRETTKAVAISRQLTYRPERETQTFDVFLSYHEEQSDWFRNHLEGDLLGNGLSFCTLHGEFNFQLPWTRRLQKAVEQSRCCVVLLSQEYVKTGRTEVELQYCMAKYLNRTFVPIRLSSCSHDCVPEYVREIITLLELDGCPENWKAKLLRELKATDARHQLYSDCNKYCQLTQKH
ncbi:uncharacterized protein LOC134179826 isoform X2 [Corticium candelabrum]|uniref:uncharacterized protein LOC134179826 isoform X2 n=1 Tax=Corticium candelabrum TaxID=121492 RepID=UPI002E25A255|nr:uncharacterized protein LOC134179826 isoform X2 [Corticium candelabrum]